MLAITVRNTIRTKTTSAAQQKEVDGFEHKALSVSSYPPELLAPESQRPGE